MSIQSYKDLLIWQKGMDLATEAYRLANKFPEQERFALANQIKRSASSIPANIAEGYGRQSTKSYMQFVKISRGFLFELETHLLLADRLGYVGDLQLFEQIQLKITEEGKMLNGFLKKLEEKGSIKLD